MNLLNFMAGIGEMMNNKQKLAAASIPVVIGWMAYTKFMPVPELYVGMGVVGYVYWGIALCMLLLLVAILVH